MAKGAALPTQGGEASASESKANEEALRKMKAEIGEDDGKPPKRESREDDVVVRDEPDEEEPGSEDDDREPERPTRRDRRQNRYTEMRNEAAQAREEAAALRGRLEAQEQYLRQLREAPARPPEPAKDPVTELAAEKDRLQKQYMAAHRAGAVTEEIYASYSQQYHALEQKISDARLDARLAEREAQLSQQMQEQAIRAQHSDVFDHPSAARWARGYYEQERAKGRHGDKALFDESMEQARATFRLSGRGGPTRETRARFAGTPSAAAGGGSADRAPSGAVTLSKEQRAMANAMYPHIKDPQKRGQLWWNKVGRTADND